MGLCTSSEPEEIRALRKHDRDIRMGNKRRKEKDRLTARVLLLGAGESGKSTVLKQMKILYGEGLDMKRMQLAIKSNIVTAVKTLLDFSKSLVEDGIVDEKEAIGPSTDDASQAAEQFLARYAQDGSRMDIDKEVGQWIMAIWADPGIQRTFEHRTYFQIMSNADYFCDQLERYLQTDFAATEEDGLRIRIRTTGLTRERFKVKNRTIEMLDVGGQKSERSKWIDQFEGVNAVIFMTAISEYDQVMFEDETTNRMHDSLELFKGLVMEPWFENSTFLLFLNKRDLFEDKFASSDLRQCFAEYPAEDETNIEKGISYIKNAFLSQVPEENPRDIIVHVTTATDKSNMETVLGAVQHSILSNDLKDMGIA